MSYCCIIVVIILCIFNAFLRYCVIRALLSLSLDNTASQHRHTPDGVLCTIFLGGWLRLVRDRISPKYLFFFPPQQTEVVCMYFVLVLLWLVCVHIYVLFRTFRFFYLWHICVHFCSLLGQCFRVNVSAACAFFEERVVVVVLACAWISTWWLLLPPLVVGGVHLRHKLCWAVSYFWAFCRKIKNRPVGVDVVAKHSVEAISWFYSICFFSFFCRERDLRKKKKEQSVYICMHCGAPQHCRGGMDGSYGMLLNRDILQCSRGRHERTRSTHPPPTLFDKKLTNKKTAGN